MVTILKSRRGMTLIELIVGMLLFAILATSVTAVFSPMLRAYTQANELAECNALLDTIANQLMIDLSEATTPLENLPAHNTVSIGYVVYLIDESGVLFRNGASVFSESLYRNRRISFVCASAEEANGTAYSLTISIASKIDGREIVSRSYAVKPIALNQYLP